MTAFIGRREFITLLGGAAAAWPLAARAQQPAMPVIGFSQRARPEIASTCRGRIPPGSERAGFVEGQNVAIEYRWADNQFDRLPELAADLVRRRVAVIAAEPARPRHARSKAATTTIPIVFSTGGDPVKRAWSPASTGLGGNVTGVAVAVGLGSKRLGAAARTRAESDALCGACQPDQPHG